MARRGTAILVSMVFPSSADGRYVAFYSFASNLVSGDTNGYTDVFVHENAISATSLTISGNAGVTGVTLSWAENPKILEASYYYRSARH